MSNDLTELKELVAAIKADHQAQKEKEKRDAWTKYVSLSMICLAVLAAVATQRGGGYSTATIKQLNEATYNQSLASDQWAYFQAKGIKQAITEQERDRVLSAGGATDAKTLDALAAKVKKYDDEKKQSSDKATEYETKRTAARELSDQFAVQSQGMGRATSLFQIAIALGGVCLVVKKRGLWWLSLATGALAVLQMAKVLLAG